MQIHLPVFQHYDCHSCGYCCRHLVVNITPQEQRRILEAGWAERLPGTRLFVHYRFNGRRLIRLAHTADHRCVFLGDDERCRLHAETGIGTKPLACRLYPFVPTPGVGGVRVDLRMDCPSVAANRGRAVPSHRTSVAEMAGEIRAVPMAGVPAWRGQRNLSEKEFRALVAAFETCLRRGAIPMRDRLRAACHLLDLYRSVRLEKVRDERFVELTELLSQAALEEASESAPASAVPPRADHLFRQWLFLHAVADDPELLGMGWLARMRVSWRRYGYSRAFVRAGGPIPPMRPDWPAMTFEQVEQIQPGDDETLEPVLRSMRLKLDAHAFAGPGYFNYDLMSGLTAWALLPALVGWFARHSAAAAGRSRLNADDVLAGVRTTHHTFGVSPVFSRISECMRLRGISDSGAVLALVTRYGP